MSTQALRVQAIAPELVHVLQRGKKTMKFPLNCMPQSCKFKAAHV